MAESDLTAQLTARLTQYSTEIGKAVDKAAKECADEMLSDLKANSPLRTGAYAMDWDCKLTENNGVGSKTYTDYNKTHYQLTHLLEKGHAGPYGRGWVREREHIASAEERWTEEFERRCEEAVKG